jgi:hypothetical protein
MHAWEIRHHCRDQLPSQPFCSRDCTPFSSCKGDTGAYKTKPGRNEYKTKTRSVENRYPVSVSGHEKADMRRKERDLSFTSDQVPDSDMYLCTCVDWGGERREARRSWAEGTTSHTRFSGGLVMVFATMDWIFDNFHIIHPTLCPRRE